MIIEVSKELLDFISEVEELERKECPSAYFTWLYTADGNGAVGQASHSYIYKEFDLHTYGDERNAYVRELGKWDYNNQETHELASDYESED